MSVEVVGTSVVDRKVANLEKVWGFSERRKVLLDGFRRRCVDAPNHADWAFVLGTSLLLYPDKFKKRVFTACHLYRNGMVANVLFSGSTDHETDDVNQGADAQRLAIEEFGLPEDVCDFVGGTNTYENVVEGAGWLRHGGCSSVFVVSDGPHLLRTMPVADYEFGKVGIKTHPFPICGDIDLDPDNPRVILEILKALAYNRVLNKGGVVDSDSRGMINEAVAFYREQLLPQLRFSDDISFEEWRRTVVQD